MNRHGWIDEADLVRELGARQMTKGDRAAGWLLALVVGIAGAGALVHWLAS